jgi:hypothetical protein
MQGITLLVFAAESDIVGVENDKKKVRFYLNSNFDVFYEE